MWSYQIWKYGEAYVVNKHRLELLNKSLSAYYSGKYCVAITNQKILSGYDANSLRLGIVSHNIKQVC